MQKFDVDDDVVELVWQLAAPRPFENLRFSDALRRILPSPAAAKRGQKISLEELIEQATARAVAIPKKAASPSAADWVASVSELRSRKGLSSWKDICDLLGIDPAGDSARRKLKAWVQVNRPSWPAVPDT